MIQSEQNKELKGLDLIFGCAQSKLQFQSDQWNSIDQKNAIVLAVYGIILAIFLAGGVANVFGANKKLLLSIWLLTIVVGMVCNLLSLRPKDIDIPPKIDSLIDKYLNKEISDTKTTMLSNMNQSISKNDEIIRKKTVMMSFSVNICLPMALGFSVLAVFLKIFKG